MYVSLFKKWKLANRKDVEPSAQEPPGIL
jgi:hypothetical protein